MSGWPPRNPLLTLRDWWRERREEREWVRQHVHEFNRRNGLCRHDDPLCRRYGCPDDPSWRGDRA